MTASSDNTPNRVFTPGRIVALALIALAVLGLAYLRFAPGDDPVSVPEGRAGRRPDPRDLRVRHRERQLRSRLRNARRAREPGRPASRG